MFAWVGDSRRMPHARRGRGNPVPQLFSWAAGGRGVSNSVDTRRPVSPLPKRSFDPDALRGIRQGGPSLPSGQKFRFVLATSASNSRKFQGKDPNVSRGKVLQQMR